MSIIAGAVVVIIAIIMVVILSRAATALGAIAGIMGQALWGIITMILGLPTAVPRIFIAIAILLIIIAIVAIVGGIYALRRRKWGLALAGSICSLVGPTWILGILAIIFLSLGKREFK